MLKHDDRLDAVEVEEGDRVIMAIHAHSHDKTGSRLEGEVIDAPSDSAREMMAEGGRPMVDFAVESDDGVIWRWNVDNGYVIGPVERAPGRSDIGKMKGFWPVDAAEE